MDDLYFIRNEEMDLYEIRAEWGTAVANKVKVRYNVRQARQERDILIIRRRQRDEQRARRDAERGGRAEG